jgi:hypothetical protein
LNYFLVRFRCKRCRVFASKLSIRVVKLQVLRGLAETLAEHLGAPLGHARRSDKRLPSTLANALHRHHLAFFTRSGETLELRHMGETGMPVPLENADGRVKINKFVCEPLPIASKLTIRTAISATFMPSHHEPTNS